MIGPCAIFAVILQIVGVYGQRSPAVAYISPLQITGAGGNAKFDCTVLYAEDYPIFWMKKNTHHGNIALATGKAVIINNGRFSVSYNESELTYTFQIKDVQETDAGTYMCQVRTSATQEVTAEVELHVLHRPYILDNSTRSTVVSEGEKVELFCYAGGFPTPMISWRRANNAVLATGHSAHTGNTLAIPSVSRKDRGTYYCIAENRVGAGATRRINVEVEFAPIVIARNPRLQQALQYDMDLQCQIEAFPTPAIVWRKDGKDLVSNQHYSISHFATADEYTDTTIRIITAEKNQYGNYVCSASNKLGIANATVELFESIVPVCPPACDIGYQATGVVPAQSGPLIALILVIAAILG